MNTVTKNVETLNEKEKQVTAAAKHFVELYGGEEWNPDTIHEWWGMTVDQYPALSLDDLTCVEIAIDDLS